jgi:hypothetical protein
MHITLFFVMIIGFLPLWVRRHLPSVLHLRRQLSVHLFTSLVSSFLSSCACLLRSWCHQNLNYQLSVHLFTSLVSSFLSSCACLLRTWCDQNLNYCASTSLTSLRCDYIVPLPISWLWWHLYVASELTSITLNIIDLCGSALNANSATSY